MIPFKRINGISRFFDIKIFQPGDPQIDSEYGHFSEKRGTIGLSPEQKGGQLIDTLEHELGHLIIEEMGIAHLVKDEEKFVNAFARGRVALKRLNPDLERWMLDELERERDAGD